MHGVEYLNPIEPPVQEGISAYWRRNTSTVESVELANLLGALRKITGYLGDNIGTVAYAGLGSVKDSTIILDPEMVTVEQLPQDLECIVAILVHFE